MLQDSRGPAPGRDKPLPTNPTLRPHHGRGPILVLALIGIVIGLAIAFAARSAAPVYRGPQPSELNQTATPFETGDQTPQDDLEDRVEAYRARVDGFWTVQRKIALLRGRGTHSASTGPRSPIRPGATPLECLTQAVYYESRGEPRDGQIAVAQVVMNRVSSGRYPASVCAVVFQGADRPGCQFSFACEGNRQGGPVNPASWARSQAVAQEVLSQASRPNNAYISGPSGADHFHADYVQPKWAGQMQRLVQIGRHIFFFSGQKSTPQPTIAPLGQAENSPLPPSEWQISALEARNTGHK
jgi:spore germination cell wall hydrolase CwlJ-like protein